MRSTDRLYWNYVAGIVQYTAEVRLPGGFSGPGGSLRRKRQIFDSRQLLNEVSATIEIRWSGVMFPLPQLFTRLSGVTVNVNSTVLSVIDTGIVSPGFPTPILITLLASNGGSPDLAANLSSLLSATAAQVGLQLVQPPQRFGENR